MRHTSALHVEAILIELKAIMAARKANPELSPIANELVPISNDERNIEKVLRHFNTLENVYDTRYVHRRSTVKIFELCEDETELRERARCISVLLTDYSNGDETKYNTIGHQQTLQKSADEHIKRLKAIKFLNGQKLQ